MSPYMFLIMTIKKINLIFNKILMPLREKKNCSHFSLHIKPRLKKSVLNGAWRLVHCIKETWSVYWRFSLPIKSGRLVFAQQRLMESGVPSLL